MSIAFSLPALDRTFQLDVSGSILAQMPDAMTDVSATAFYNFKTNVAKSVFKYQSDSFDVNNLDASDTRYYVFMDSWPTDASLNPANALMSDSPILPEDGNIVKNRLFLKHDYTRYLAFRLFNTPYGVDLFNNETEIHQDICSKGRTAKDNIMTLLRNVSTKAETGSTIVVGNTDLSSNRYTTNDSSLNTNICRELIRQIGYSAPGRFYDVSSNGYTMVSNSNYPYRTVPLFPGDSFNFKVTVKAATNQHLLTNRALAIEDRVYKIKLILSDTANTVPTDGTATNLLDYIPNV